MNRWNKNASARLSMPMPMPMAVVGVEALDLSTLLAALPACSRCRHARRRCDTELPSCRNCAKKKVDCIYHDHVLQEDLPRSYIASLVNHLQTDRNKETPKLTANEPQQTQVIQPAAHPISSTRVLHQFAHNNGTYRHLGGNTLIRDIIETPAIHPRSGSHVPELPILGLDVEDVEISPELHEYLVTNFFSGIHQVYPILDPSSPCLLLNGAMNGPNDAFALQMIYSISCLSSPEHPKLSRLGASCYRRALVNIGNATVEPTLATLQVATLLALHSLLDPASGNIGQHIAFAVRLSIGLADTDGPDQDPLLWSLHSVVYVLENTVATALDRINAFPEPAGPIEFEPTDQSKFLCSLYRLQARFRNNPSTKSGAILDEALAVIDTAGEGLHPIVRSVTLETQLLLEPSPLVAIRLLRSYEHPRFIATFVTPYWTHLAGTYIKRDFDNKEIPRSDLFRAFGTAMSLLTKFSLRWPGVEVMVNSLRISL